MTKIKINKEIKIKEYILKHNNEKYIVKEKFESPIYSYKVYKQVSMKERAEVLKVLRNMKLQ